MNILPELRRLKVPVDSIEPHPDNPRRGNIDLIAESLATNGQYKPVYVQKSTGYVVAGNHTLRAARQLGWTHIAARQLDIDDALALRVLLVDNRTSDVATYDDDELVRVLEGLVDAAGLEGTGWVMDELEDLVARLDAVPQTDDEPFGGGYVAYYRTRMIDCEGAEQEAAKLSNLYDDLAKAAMAEPSTDPTDV